MGQNRKQGYAEIKEIILGRLKDGTWPAETRLPDEITLAGSFGCARATVNRALRELADEGFLSRKRKSGTHVNRIPQRQARFQIPSVRDEIEATRARYRYHLLHREPRQAPAWLRGRIGLADHDQVLHLHCVHYADNEPFQFEDRWINLTAVPSAADESFDQRLPGEWLIERMPYTDVEMTFSATAADLTQAEYLSVNRGQSLFVIERTTWLKDAPVTYARLSHHAGYKLKTGY